VVEYLQKKQTEAWVWEKGGGVGEKRHRGLETCPDEDGGGGS